MPNATATVSDREVYGVMLDGAVKVCDHAIAQWESGKYGSDPTPQIAKWRAIRSRVREIVAELKKSA